MVFHSTPIVLINEQQVTSLSNHLDTTLYTIRNTSEFENDRNYDIVVAIMILIMIRNKIIIFVVVDTILREGY